MRRSVAAVSTSEGMSERAAKLRLSRTCSTRALRSRREGKHNSIHVTTRGFSHASNILSISIKSQIRYMRKPRRRHLTVATLRKGFQREYTQAHGTDAASAPLFLLILEQSLSLDVTPCFLSLPVQVGEGTTILFLLEDPSSELCPV